MNVQYVVSVHTWFRDVVRNVPHLSVKKRFRRRGVKQPRGRMVLHEHSSVLLTKDFLRSFFHSISAGFERMGYDAFYTEGAPIA